MLEEITDSVMSMESEEVAEFCSFFEVLGDTHDDLIKAASEDEDIAEIVLAY